MLCSKPGIRGGVGLLLASSLNLRVVINGEGRTLSGGNVASAGTSVKELVLPCRDSGRIPSDLLLVVFEMGEFLCTLAMLLMQPWLLMPMQLEDITRWVMTGELPPYSELGRGQGSLRNAIGGVFIGVELGVELVEEGAEESNEPTDSSPCIIG